MTAWWVAAALSLVSAIVVGWVLPAWAMARLMPSLEQGRTVENYRGRTVVHGLGIVWLVWLAGWAIGQSVWQAVLAVVSALESTSGTLRELVLGAPWTFVVADIVLVAGVFALGLADDMFGDDRSRGFRGHIAALRSGRLTTGALKMFGIGAFGAAAAVAPAMSSSGIGSSASGGAIAAFLIAWVLGALVIALSANLVNLTDLRPGRALKVYLGLVTLGLVATVWRGWTSLQDSAVASRVGASQPLQALAVALTLAILVLGPVAAVWRFDLGERAMLGDAGANAMGAIAGFLLVRSLPVWLLAIVAAILVALNLASERISFSSVIERRPLLRWIDGLGRLAPEAAVGMAHERTHGDVTEGDAADRADAGTGKDGGS